MHGEVVEENAVVWSTPPSEPTSKRCHVSHAFAWLGSCGYVKTGCLRCQCGTYAMTSNEGFMVHISLCSAWRIQRDIVYNPNFIFDLVLKALRSLRQPR